MVKKIQINMSNKLFYALVVFGVVSLLGVGVYAYGTFDPTVMGHSAGELGNVATQEYVDIRVAGLQGQIDTLSGAVNDLAHGLHSSAYCETLGGEVVMDGGDSFCKINGTDMGGGYYSTACPDGWFQFGYWSTTTQNPICACSTGSHLWADIDNSGETCWTTMLGEPMLCRSMITQIGCY